jgi:hypothetical protein
LLGRGNPTPSKEFSKEFSPRTLSLGQGNGRKPREKPYLLLRFGLYGLAFSVNLAGKFQPEIRIMLDQIQFSHVHLSILTSMVKAMLLPRFFMDEIAMGEASY